MNSLTKPEKLKFKSCKNYLLQIILFKKPGKVSAIQLVFGTTALSLAFFLSTVLITSCSNTKFLGEDEKLYTYTWFSQKGFGEIKDKPYKAYELFRIGKAPVNRNIIGFPRTELLIYNYMHPKRDRGFKHWFYNLTAKPPVLLKDANPELRQKIMQQRMFDMGHFDSEINLDLKVYGKDGKKVRAKYDIIFRPSYTFRNLEYIQSSVHIDSIINSSLSMSLVTPGDDYWVSTLKTERSRLNTILRDKGFFYFNPDYLIFYADTTVGNKQVDMMLGVKDEIPKQAFELYTIRQINVHVRSARKNLLKPASPDPIKIDSIFFRQDENFFKPKHIANAISITPGEDYSFTDQDNTTRYLQGMKAFRLVDISYTETDSTSNQLDANIELIPLKPVQAGIEFNFATKSNDFLGPNARASLSHTNIFKGAEQLILEIDGGFEWQKRSRRKEYELGVNSFELGTRLKLSVPRFLLPYHAKNLSERYVPRTNVSIGFRSLRRVKYYNMMLSQSRFSYNWKKTGNLEFRFDPFAIDYLRVTEKSEEFNDFLIRYPAVAKSFEEQFIPGSLFQLTYASPTKWKQHNKFVYSGTIDVAGNMISLIYRLNGNGKPDSDNPYKLFNTPYSQYAKITNDFRYYYNFTEKLQIATRLLAGIGMPYSNSSVLPYVKQYFAGGSQDNRAFYARSIGPGSYQPSDSLSESALLDQSGDIKLFASAEYRFPITYLLNGALFVDAGNVWLINKDETRPGGQFGLDSFFNEMAVGFGIGVRVDLEYVIIRFDAAIPIRKPYKTDGNQWIFKDPSYVKDFILSLSIGYPF